VVSFALRLEEEPHLVVVGNMQGICTAVGISSAKRLPFSKEKEILIAVI